MSESQIDFLFRICFVGIVLIYGMTRKIIHKRRTVKQKQITSIHCHHCGSPMLESDIFCENCWKITPNVNKTLSSHPNRKREFYSDLGNEFKLRCPHCNSFYRYAKRLYASNTLGSPIKYCTHCHNYFLDYAYTEWSVTPFSVKFLDFFSIWHLLVYLAIFLLIVSCALEGDWFIVPDLTILLLALICIHSAFVLVRCKLTDKKSFHESTMRLEQNPEYPQILIDMGYGNMMSKEYHHLSKEPIVSRKDKLKELLKDAFTFD